VNRRTATRRGMVLVALLGAVGAARSGPTDRIAVAVSTASAPVALFNGWQNGQCRAFKVIQQLDAPGDVAAPGTPDCRSTVVVFARGYAPTFLTNPQWDADDGGLVLRVAPTAPTEIPIRSWVVTNAAAEPWEFANASLIEASARLKEERAGLVLVDLGVERVPRSDYARSAVIGSGCGSVDAIRADPGVYVAGAVNVFYVTRITEPNTDAGITRGETDTGAMGYNCGEFGAPEIIFIDYNGAYQATLLHELGHTLGFWEPNGGHLALDGNFMVDGGQVAGGEITLGQVFRMHFDSRSWLNRRDNLLNRPVVITCQVSLVLDRPCPRLSRKAD
jgi:hypothetical protein